MESENKEAGSSPAPSMKNLDVTISKGRELTVEDINKMKVDYVHDLLKIIERQDFQVYAVKLGRLMEIDRKFKKANLRTIITVSTEAFAEHQFEEKDLRHLTEKDLSTK